MGTLYTKDEFFDRIDKEKAWRVKELLAFKNQIESLTKNPSNQNVLLRASVPLLYAHWEGFVKTSCETYLKFVSGKRIILNKLQPQFAAIALGKQIQSQEMKKISTRTESVKFIVDNLEKPSDIPTNGVIKTKSNLKFEVFEDICFILNIDSKQFETKKATIDDLVDNRNTIAHGNYQKITTAIYSGFHKEVLELLELLRTELDNAVSLEKYKI